jgi:phytoene/squalene synthetase
MTPIEQSYRYAHGITRERAKNFYYAFVLLDQQRRNSLCATT